MTGKYYIVRWRAKPDVGAQFGDVYLMSDNFDRSVPGDQSDIRVTRNVREAWRFKYKFLPGCIAQARSRHDDYHLPADVTAVFVEETVAVSLLLPDAGEGAAA